MSFIFSFFLCSLSFAPFPAFLLSPFLFRDSKRSVTGRRHRRSNIPHRSFQLLVSLSSSPHLVDLAPFFSTLAVPQLSSFFPHLVCVYVCESDLVNRSRQCCWKRGCDASLCIFYLSPYLAHRQHLMCFFLCSLRFPLDVCDGNVDQHVLNYTHTHAEPTNHTYKW